MKKAIYLTCLSFQGGLQNLLGYIKDPIGGSSILIGHCCRTEVVTGDYDFSTDTRSSEILNRHI